MSNLLLTISIIIIIHVDSIGYQINHPESQAIKYVIYLLSKYGKQMKWMFLYFRYYILGLTKLSYIFF